jgi:hypothetical protein
MATMWVLLWLQVIPATGVNHFQLGSYESLQKCSAGLELAKVMITTTNTQVVCVMIGIGRTE